MPTTPSGSQFGSSTPWAQAVANYGAAQQPAVQNADTLEAKMESRRAEDAAANKAFEAAQNNIVTQLQQQTGSSIGDILNSPEYRQALLDYFNTVYAPGAIEAQRQIDAANTAFTANEQDRARTKSAAIKRAAANYAGRGLRTPEMVNQTFAETRLPFEAASRADKAAIKALQDQAATQYGETKANAGTSFLDNPMLFGAIGAGARQNALQNASTLVSKYNLPSLAGGFTAGANAAQQVLGGVSGTTSTGGSSSTGAAPANSATPAKPAGLTGAAITDAYNAKLAQMVKSGMGQQQAVKTLQSALGGNLSTVTKALTGGSTGNVKSTAASKLGLTNWKVN